VSELEKVKDTPSEIVENLRLIVNDLATKFNAHKHRLDLSGGASPTAVSGVPVTGTATGTPTGGTAIADANTLTAIL
jgi:hypothetical protein